MNTNHHYLNYYKRRTGHDPRALRYHRIDYATPLLLPLAEPEPEPTPLFDAQGFLLPHVGRDDTGYRDCWTPGPWLVEFIAQQDGRVLWEIVGERATPPWGGREQEANRHMIEGALGCYEGVCGALAYLRVPAEQRDRTLEAELIDFLQARKREAEGR